MNIYAKEGQKIIITEDSSRNGSDYDREKLNQYLLVGSIYTVSWVDVGNFASRVYIKEVTEVPFNTVCFEDYITETESPSPVDAGREEHDNSVGFLKCCDVPTDVHGTCCGWRNASCIVDEGGFITDKRHPDYNKHFINRSLSKDATIVNVNNNQAATPDAGREEQDVYICQNCKLYHHTLIKRCECGSTSLVKTHPSNYAHIPQPPQPQQD